MLDGNKTVFINGVNSTVYHTSDNGSANWRFIGAEAFNGTVYNIQQITDTAIEVWI